MNGKMGYDQPVAPKMGYEQGSYTAPLDCTDCTLGHNGDRSCPVGYFIKERGGYGCNKGGMIPQLRKDAKPLERTEQMCIFEVVP